MNLTCRRFKFRDPLERSRVLDEFRSSGKAVLVLDTCQRAECYGFDLPEISGDCEAENFDSMEAFERLARIAAGVESRILGELEVLGQVRKAYKNFTLTHGSEAKVLDRLFQDVLSLARRARRLSGIDQKLTSLSGIASRLIIEGCPEGKPIAVVGTGSLASSVIRSLSKRGCYPIRIMSRCPDRAIQLALTVDGFGAGLDDLVPQLEGVAGIVAATNAPHPVIYANHLENTHESLHIVDLGEPPNCSVDVHSLEHVKYTGLLDVEACAQLNSEHRQECSAIAQEIISSGVKRWSQRGRRAAPVSA